MAQQWPSGGFQKHYKTHMILTFRARRACQERPQEGPQEQNIENYIGFTTFWTVAIGPLLGHQWGVKKTHPGQQGRQRGAIKSAQTVYFKPFTTNCAQNVF